MEIHEAYDLSGSFRATAAVCGVELLSVRRHVAARAAGLALVADLERPKVSDPYPNAAARLLVVGISVDFRV